MDSTKKIPMSSAIDHHRLLRTIRIQGAINILLVAALIGLWAWTRNPQRIPTIEGVVSGLRPEIRISMPVIALEGDRQLQMEDIVHRPEILIYGKVENFITLREHLDRFTVLLQGTTIVPKRDTGEFAERLILSPGQNIVDLVLKWEGKEQKRLQYQLSYIPEISGESTTSTTP